MPNMNENADKRIRCLQGVCHRKNEGKNRRELKGTYFPFSHLTINKSNKNRKAKL